MFSVLVSDQTSIQGGTSVAVTSRVLKDRRNISRISTRFSCHFTHEGVSREAVVINLSLNGAQLSSKFMPPLGASVALILKPPALSEPLKLEGKVIRGAWGISDHGAIGKFGVRFNPSSASLINLINMLK